jgi:dienelactone hydrolase
MRKRLWILGVAAFFLAACQTGGISFPNAKLYARDSIIESVPGLLAKPKGSGPFPAVVLLQTCGGMKPHVTDAWPGYLTGLGYVTLTVNSLGARGHTKCTRQNFMAKNYHEITMDAYGALDYLAGQPFVDREKVAVMGFSMGAAAIHNELVPRLFRENGELDFKAAIAVYGYCSIMRKGPIPLMLILPEKDKLTAGCLRIAKINPWIKVHVIPGAYHAFDSLRGSGRSDLYGNRMLYDANATAKAKEFTKDFLEKHFGG